MSDRVIVLTERPATVKCIHNINFEMKNRTPLNCRENPKFNVERTWRKKYIKSLWKYQRLFALESIKFCQKE